MLLDLNLRSPDLVRMFGIELGGGAAEQLRRKRRDPDAYWDVLELGSRLHLISGGTPTENPATLLNSEEMPRLIYDVAEHYDYIVVDLPAVSGAADVKIVQEQLDGVVMVCRAGKTNKAAITNAMKQLGPGKLQGALLLDVKPRYMPK
jgi:Mrp family chromosome partitioning ATPase